MARKNHHCLLTDIAYGLAAGAAATFVMDKVSTFAYQLEDESTRRHEENLRRQEYPPEVLAGKIAKALCGVELDKETKQKRASAIHWGYGIFWGGVFGALRDRAPLVGSACGLAFGFGLWLIGDEVMMPVLGLTPPSLEFPWPNHARAAANHLAYGGTLGVTHGLLRKIGG
ncbi:MAG: DUF1440 domain-containing protein [Bryobacteraceae bacterium]